MAQGLPRRSKRAMIGAPDREPLTGLPGFGIDILLLQKRKYPKGSDQTQILTKLTVLQVSP